MTITMLNARTPSIQALTTLLSAAEGIQFSATNREETYVWIEETLRASGYLHLPKAEKGILRRYLQKMTGYSRQQLTRLIAQFRQTTRVQAQRYTRHRFPRRYVPEDIALLADVDAAHRQLSGPATKRILVREYTVFRNEEFARLSGISPSHLANLRRTFTYREKTKRFQKTRPTQIPIGERRKPEPNGEPGYLRVDSVHQGDSHDGTKGVYHVNLVDEVLQWELVVCVERISERFLVPALEAVLDQFPFVLRGFHTDNGSEFINQVVAKLLEKLRVDLTKSRPRRENDNGLVETKNGAIIRKHLGYGHISQRHAAVIHRWYQEWFNVYLNFHRPCAFGKEVVVNPATGKRKRVYPTGDYQTPYEKFRSLPRAHQFLKPGMTFAALDRVAYACSDTDFARQMQEAKRRLFPSLSHH